MSPSSANALQTIRQWQSESDAIREAPEPATAQWAVILLAGLFFSLIAMTPFVRVDRMVGSQQGKVVSTESVSTFQALDPSIIKSIDVKEGQQVDKGQLLATLDSTFAAADVGQLTRQIAGLDAQITRLKAEQNKVPLVFPGDVPVEEVPYIGLQKALFDQRASEFAAQLRSFDEKMKTTEATLAKLRADAERYEAREKISHQIENMRDTLYKSGSSSLLNLLQANDARLEMLRTMENGHNSLIESQHQLSSISADKEAFVQQWFTQSSQDLVKAENERDAAVGSLKKATKHQDLVRLVAPEPSVVLSMSKLSVGSVLKAGDELMTLVPTRAPMEAEVHLRSSDIGFVRPGDHCLIKIDAFNSTEHGMAEGTLRWISEGSFTTSDDGKPVEAYYKARVKIDAFHFTGVPEHFRLIPGMTLHADVNVGTRSLFSYVIGGAIGAVGESMRER